jgi:Ca-activated chloride channel family protein
MVHAHVPILVFTLGYGHAADTSTLEAISSATGAHYFNASNPDTIKQILADDLVTSF